MVQFAGRIAESLAIKILESGISWDRGHPISTQCPDLVLEYMNVYNPNTIEVIASNNKVIVWLYPSCIVIAFQLPTREHYENIDIRMASEYYVANQTQCLNTSSRSCFSQPMKCKSQFAKSIHGSSLKEHDLQRQATHWLGRAYQRYPS